MTTKIDQRKSTEIDPEITKMLELAAKTFKVTIPTILNEEKQNTHSMNKEIGNVIREIEIIFKRNKLVF